MDDALAMGSLKRLGYLPRNRQRFDERKRTALDPVRERDAFDEFEDQGWPAMRLFEPIDGANMRMIQRGECLRLAPESRQAVGIEFKRTWEHLQRNIAIQLAVACAKHFAHSARPQQSDDAVRSDGGVCGEQRPRSGWIGRCGNLGDGRRRG